MLTVATYNIAPHKQTKIEDMRLLLEKYNIDVAGIQEVDVDTNDHPYNTPQLFTKGTFKDVYFSKTVNKNQGEYGVATLSRLPILERTCKIYQEMTEITEPRLYQRVVIKKGHVKIAIYNTHLSFETIESRQKQLHQLKRAFESDPMEYKIIVGDLNVDKKIDELDLFKSYQILNTYFGHLIPTFQEEDPEMNIYTVDYIITTNNFTPKVFTVVQNDLSDHSLVLSNLEIH